jgi:hypothetical protein
MANMANYLRKKLGATRFKGATTNGPTNVPDSPRIALPGKIKKVNEPAKTKKAVVRPSIKKDGRNKPQQGKVKKAANTKNNRLNKSDRIDYKVLKGMK